MSNQHSWFSLSLHKQHILPIQVVEKKNTYNSIGKYKIEKDKNKKMINTSLYLIENVLLGHLQLRIEWQSIWYKISLQ